MLEVLVGLQRGDILALEAVLGQNVELAECLQLSDVNALEGEVDGVAIDLHLVDVQSAAQNPYTARQTPLCILRMRYMQLY